MADDLGGSSVLTEFYIGGYDYAVESPLKERAYELKDELVASYDQGQKLGGYFKIMQIAKAPAVDGEDYGTFYDVWVFTGPIGQNAHQTLKAENDTKSAKYWDDQPGVSGLKNYVTGIARIIKYYRTYGADAENLVLVEILEGEVVKGEAKGFVRKIKSARGTSFLGDLDGERPMGKGIYIEDYEVMWQGKWSAAQEKYTEEPAALMEFTSFDPLDNQVVVDEDALGEERMDKAYD
jgi:hypothetical protein